MAKENFKKEQELLRHLFLFGGAYNRAQISEKLGIKISYNQNNKDIIKQVGVIMNETNTLNILNGQAMLLSLKWNSYAFC